MVKILLAACNAKYIHSNLAVHSLRAYLAKYRPELSASVLVREYTINQQKDEILKEIYRIAPDVVCFSCYIWNSSYTADLIRDLSRILPHTRIWAGGPEAGYRAEQFLTENPALTGVMIGEGEQTFLRLAETYARSEGEHRMPTAEDWREIPGIAYREQGEILLTAPAAPLDLDSVPFPYEDLEPFRNRILYYESSRGCPFSCSYCLSSIEKQLRFRSISLVERELQYFLDQRVPQVKFVDRTFNCRHSHSLAIWRYLRDHDNGVTNFHFEIAADLLTEEELECISGMRPGLIQLEIGVQSTNPATLEEIRRKTDFSLIAQKVARVQAMGNTHQHLDLIAGLPYEDLDTFRKSFADVYALRPDQLQLGFLKVLSGSYMYEAAEEYGCVYKSREPYEVLSTKWLSYGELLLLKSVEEMVEIYYNSGQFTRTLRYVEPFFDSAFEMYRKLGAFYEERGYDLISHSRLRRYEILMEFLQGREEISMEKVREEMLTDLYLRENLKNRPDWAPDQKSWEKAVRTYRKEHGISRTAHVEAMGGGRALLFDYEHRDPLTRNASMTEILLSEKSCCRQE